MHKPCDRRAKESGSLPSNFHRSHQNPTVQSKTSHFHRACHATPQPQTMQTLQKVSKALPKIIYNPIQPLNPSSNKSQRSLRYPTLMNLHKHLTTVKSPQSEKSPIHKTTKATKKNIKKHTIQSPQAFNPCKALCKRQAARLDTVAVKPLEPSTACGYGAALEPKAGDVFSEPTCSVCLE